MIERRYQFQSDKNVSYSTAALAICMIFILVTPILMIPALFVNNSNTVLSSMNEFKEESFNTRENEVGILAENGEWIPFIDGAIPGTRSSVLPKSRDTMGLCVDSTFFGLYNYTETIDDVRYNILNVPSAGHADDIGKPAVPLVTRYFEVPFDVNISVRVLYDESQILDDFYLIPAQMEPPDTYNVTMPDFTIHNATYIANEFYPENIAIINGGSEHNEHVIRGHRIVALTLFPLQFNPIQREIRAYSKIEVRLDYSRPAQVEPVPGRLASGAFEDFCQGLILNYQYRPGFGAMLGLGYESGGDQTDTVLATDDNRAEYLIIVNDTFYNEILPLAEWKEKKGLITKVVKTSEISVTTPTADQVKNFIQDAYDTWSLAPTYVLLVGDSNHILPHYQTINLYPGLHGFFDTPTDLYYGTVEGTDYYPDIFVGRMSVDTPAQVTTIVNKILDYEKTPPDPLVNPEFYSNVAACGYFQDNPPADNQEDFQYILTLEEVLRQGTYNGLESLGYTALRTYTSDTATPQTYSTGAAIPNDLLAGNFNWNGDRNHITSNITEGRFLVFHRDHGDSRNFFDHSSPIPSWGVLDGWNFPEYLVGDIAGLANGPLLPLVLSVECMCGWYDNEVDNETWGGGDAALTRDVESFCEEFLRHPGGGAIATIGATRGSPTGPNNRFLKGMIDAMWPEFDDDFNSGGLYSFSQMMLFGKVYAAQFFPATSFMIEEEFELYNLFGDPETSLWTSAPRTLDVSYPSVIGSSATQDFVITVTDGTTGDPINFAKICLMRGTDIYKVVYTDPFGHAYISMTPGTTGDIEITVTRHNYVPHEGLIGVSSNGANLIVTPDQGPGGMELTIDGSSFGVEIVDIDFGGVATTADSTDGTFSKTYSVPENGAGPLNVVATGRDTNRVGVTIFRRMDDGTDLYTYCQGESSTWTLNPEGSTSSDNPVWNSPSIWLEEKLTGNEVSSRNLEVGTTYIIHLRIYNRAPVTATDTRVSFEWGYYGGGQVIWNLIETQTGEEYVSVNVPAASGTIVWIEGQAVAEMDWSPSVTGHVCLRPRFSHPWDLNTVDNWGQENTEVKPVTSPGVTNFTVYNPTEERALVYIDLRQMGNLDDIWEVVLERDYPQELDPGENQTVFFNVNVPDDVPLNETRTFIVNMYIGDELIGGVQIDVVKSEPIVPPPPFDWTGIFIGLGVVAVVVIIVVVVIFIRRR